MGRTAAEASPRTAPADTPAVTFAGVARTVLTLRVALLAILVAMLPAGERLLGFHVRYGIALGALAAAVAAHLVLARAWAARPAPRAAEPPAWIGVALDLGAITAVLAASGGAANPFSALFFVYVALAASLLPARATFAITALAAGLFGVLFALPGGSCCPSHPENGAFSAHLYGMWLAFVAGAGLVAYFSTRVRRALEQRDAELARLRRDGEQAARFAALGTLAAGTAHELATPLGTIAVLAGELRDTAAAPDAARAAQTIADQVARCRDVIGRMQAGARRPAGSVTAVGPAVLRAVETWRAAHPTARVIAGTDVPEAVPLSADDVEAAVCVLLDNALFASERAGASEPIKVDVSRDRDGVAIRVEDAGLGIPRDIGERLGEPFLTTKQPGEGMGLGLYLVRTLLEGVGGRLDVAPRQPAGTRVTLRLLATDG